MGAILIIYFINKNKILSTFAALHLYHKILIGKQHVYVENTLHGVLHKMVSKKSLHSCTLCCYVVLKI